MDNKQTIEFSLRRFPYEYGVTFFVFWTIIFFPLTIYQLFIQHCVDPSIHIQDSTVIPCQIPDWGTPYILTVFILILIAVLTGHFAKPWQPFLTISKNELGYNRIPFFLHFSILDKLLWKKFPMQSIATIELVIRTQDAEKAGFKLAGNEDDVNKFVKNVTYDEYMDWIGNNSGAALSTSSYYPYYKNQKLALLNKEGEIITELTVSFAYEEDLQKLHTFLQEKGIPFTITFRYMNDEINDLYN